MAFCPNCGNEIQEGSACAHCSPPPPNLGPDSNTDIKEQGKNFFASLFDFNMKEMITPKVIKIVFIIGVIGIGFAVLAGIFTAFSAATGPFGSWGGFFATLIFAPLGGLIGVIFFRIYMEIILLLFHIYDELKAIRKENKQ